MDAEYQADGTPNGMWVVILVNIRRTWEYRQCFFAEGQQQAAGFAQEIAILHPRADGMPGNVIVKQLWRVPDAIRTMYQTGALSLDEILYSG